MDEQLSLADVWVQRMGRRQLLTVSTFGAISSLALVGLGLDTGIVTLSSIAILTFVTCASPSGLFKSGPNEP